MICVIHLLTQPTLLTRISKGVFNMKTIEIMRQSGLPLDPADVEKYIADWRELFDKCQEKVNASKDTDRYSPDRLPRLLNRVEQILMKRYKNIDVIEFPKSNKAWLKLWNQYGNIMVAKRADSDVVILAIKDQS